MQRFEDHGQFLIDFIDRVIVTCDRCGEVATVSCEQPYHQHEPVLQCTRCSNHRRGWGQSTIGPFGDRVRGRCTGCTSWVDVSKESMAAASSSGSKKEHVVVYCQQCKTKNLIRVKWRGLRLGLPFDPYFGLPVALQTSCCGETLWAYNEAHLSFLESFVAADLRQRDGHLNQSLVSRLPKWMKKAGNRDAVRRAIARLWSQRG